MYIIGISAFYHDSAAALIKDGKIVAAAQEERFTRIKNDSSFPLNAINFLFEDNGLSESDIEQIIFYDKPWLKFERILDSTLQFAPHTLKQFIISLPSWLSEKLNFRKLMKTKLKDRFPLLAQKEILFSEHHFSHAASTFYTSPFTDSAVLTIDGVGEWATTTIFSFSEDSYTKHEEMHYPDSIGLLYSAFTMFCGFKVNSGEYKLMGLAPYGDKDARQTREFIKIIKDKLLTIHNDGSINLNLKYFKFHHGKETINRKGFEKIFNLKTRDPNSTITQDYCNYALAAQIVIEEIILKLCKHTKDITGCDNLCLAGGVALNCVANHKILLSKLFKNIWIHPAPGDAGGAVGCALGYYYSMYKYTPHDFNPYLGPSFSNKEIEVELKRFKLNYTQVDYDDLYSKVASALAQSEIVGWFQDRMEWGPRALGNRSILGNPKDQQMQQKLNLKIKFRESFRPFAPITLEEDLKENFETDINLPYMQFTVPVKNSSINEIPTHNNLPEKLKAICSPLPAITHLDLSARVQSVSKAQNPKMHALLNEFKKKTGHGTLINTSFNVRGEPIVCSPKNAIECFLSTEMDILVLNNFLIQKSDISENQLTTRSFALD